MSTAVIALKLTKSVPRIHADYIGADKGALTLASAGIRMKLAVGDFDSVKPEDLDLIRHMSEKTVVLNPIKDDSDSESAISHVKALGYERIILCGALGGRADHTLVNLRLVYENPQRVSILDEQNDISAYGPGRYEIEKGKYPYISFFTFEEAVISLENMKYPLEKRKITARDLYTLSNEILSGKGVLMVHSGKVLVIQLADANI